MAYSLTVLPRKPLVSAALGLTALVLTALTLVGCAAAAPARPVAADSAAPVVEPTDGPRPTVVAIGDSIAIGMGVRPEEAWPALIADQHGWRLTNLAVSGSGFVRAGWDGTTYADQVATALTLQPDYILIAATRNDRDEDPALVESSARKLLSELRSMFPRARIIGITGVWGSDQPPATMTAVNTLVKQAVSDADGTFLDIGFPLVDHPELVQPDGVHPNAAGERVVADVIEERLASISAKL